MTEKASSKDGTPSTPDDAMAWSGRFAVGPGADMIAFSRSVEVDSELWQSDIDGSLAHLKALEGAGVINADESGLLEAALMEITGEFAQGQFAFNPEDEDIHMAIERRLTEIAGDAGRKIHTGRSRNDQVALDLRLHLTREARGVADAVLSLASALIIRADEAADRYLPGYTHMQKAQPVLVAHHLCAHVWPLLRDVARLRDASERANVSPLGAGALAGTSIPVDPSIVVSELSMSAHFENSMDAVADRDFAAEYLFVMALIQVHLSRFAEELVLWATDEFGFISLPDEWATGSSMMPQKKNPDVPELVRGRTGRVIGNLVNLLVVLKGLPLTYNRDLQEDKRPVLDSLAVVEGSARALTGLVSGMGINFEAMELATREGFLSATDLAEELTMAGVPFRDAHRIVGGLVLELERAGRSLDSVNPAELVDLHPELGALDPERLSPASVIEARSGPGGTGPSAVSAQLQKAREAVAEFQAWASSSTP